MLYKAKSKKDFKKFQCLLEEYIAELHTISETVKVRKGKALKKDYFDIPDMDYFLIKEKNIIIGFALIGYRSNCKIGVDKYISEFYIIPQYRRKYCGEKAIKEILKDTNSAILAILKKNTVAEKFWTKIFENWRLKEIVDDDDVFFYTYEKEA